MGWIHDDASRKWLLGLAFQDDALAFSESLATLHIVGLDAGQEFVTALRGLDVLDTDVDALGKDLSAVTLVYDDSECVLGDVVDATSLSVIGLEGHTFVDSSVTLKWSEFSLALFVLQKRRDPNSP